MGGNNITSLGARAIARALTVNQSLVRLLLRDNVIRFDGCRTLVDSLAVHTRLAYINLTGNELTQQECDAVVEIAEESCAFTVPLDSFAPSCARLPILAASRAPLSLCTCSISSPSCSLSLSAPDSRVLSPHTPLAILASDMQSRVSLACARRLGDR